MNHNKKHEVAKKMKHKNTIASAVKHHKFVKNAPVNKVLGIKHKPMKWNKEKAEFEK